MQNKQLKQKIADLLADVMTGKFGTKNRSELIIRLEEIHEGIYK